MKTHWNILSPDGKFILASMTLYGDSDKATDAALLTFLRESIAIARVRCGDPRVVVTLGEIDI